MQIKELTLAIVSSPKIYVNLSLVYDIYRKKDGNSTQISFGNDYVLSVTETPEQILKGLIFVKK